MVLGFSSKNGAVTVLTNLGKHQANKVIDTDIRTTYCHTCPQKNRDNVKLSTTAKDHCCAVNHQESADKMEADGAVACFKRSKAKYGVQYTKYLGDGDSKAFTTVNSMQIYDKPIIKEERTGHVQKQMGKALMNAVAEQKLEKFIVDANGQQVKKKVANPSRGVKCYSGIGGVNRLTKKAIMSIQGHYGAAIRENNTLESMESAIWAIYHHRSGNHTSCPDWCAATNGDLAKANKHRLPAFVCNIMKPIFTRLSSADLLSRCVHGRIQKANEAFHLVLRNLCPYIVVLIPLTLEYNISMPLLYISNYM